MALIRSVILKPNICGNGTAELGLVRKRGMMEYAAVSMTRDVREILLDMILLRMAGRLSDF